MYPEIGLILIQHFKNRIENVLAIKRTSLTIYKSHNS